MCQTIHLPSYTLQADAYKEIPAICTKFGNKIALIGGQTALNKTVSKIKSAIANTSLTINTIKEYGGIASMVAVEILAQDPLIQKADMLFAVGGGRAIDTIKVLAQILNKPVFTFPTLASNCAPITQLSVLYNHQTGEFQELYPLSNCPQHCFIDLNIILDSPYNYFWAGLGDALSKQYETCFSMRNRHFIGRNNLGYQIAANCSEQLYLYGEDALKSHKKQIITEALMETVGIIIINTGLVSILVDLDYSSSLAHSLYYGFTTLPQGEKYLHGAVVNYGTLVLLTLDKDWDNLQKLYNFSKACKLPYCRNDLSLNSTIELKKMINFAMNTEDIKVAPYPITEELILDAIETLEKKELTV